MKKKSLTMGVYIAQSNSRVRPRLVQIRKEIKRRIPNAKETISYGIPAFKDEKVFFYFAGFKNHIGVYPPTRDKGLINKLKAFRNSKGNLLFPNDLEIPIKLIGDVAVSNWKRYKR